MTIIFSAKRDHIALLAADRMHKYTDEATQKITCLGREKLAYHKEYPLVCAVAGMLSLPRDATVQAHVQAVLDSIGPTPSLDGRLIANRLDGRIRPLMTLDGFVKIWIALLLEGNASITYCQITNEPPDILDEGYTQWNAPNNLVQWYPSQESFKSLSDPSVRDWQGLSQRLVAVVSAGIHEEAKRHDGRNTDCGLGIDIAVLSPEFGLRRCQVPVSDFPPAAYPQA